MKPGPGEEIAGARELVIGGELAGARLDRVLAGLVPEGLRGRRRRIADGAVLLNGRPCREAGRRVKSGDLLALAARKEAPNAAEARLLGRSGDYCFLCKGAGLHSAALAGKDGDSLEARLPSLCGPVLQAGDRPQLLQRLDRGTSGIVCAALNGEAARAFRAAEAAGHCEKRYLALLTGILEAPATARRRLDVNGRRTSRLLDEDAGPLRSTEFLPLQVWEGEECARLCRQLGAGPAPAALTLAACRIRLGARHQIRAHAAGLGHPLLGDAQYARPTAAATSEAAPPQFFLHHGLLGFPGARCSVAPPWPWLDESLRAEGRPRVRAWLEMGD